MFAAGLASFRNTPSFTVSTANACFDVTSSGVSFCNEFVPSLLVGSFRDAKLASA
jgi:hypothetical protein